MGRRHSDPVEGCVQRLFSLPDRAAELGSWRARRSSDPDRLVDVYDGDVWREQIDGDPLMAADARNLAVGIFTDPFVVSHPCGCVRI